MILNHHVRYVELDITLTNVIICRNMSRHPPIFIVHSANLWAMMRRIVGNMNSCMKYQGMHIEFKEKYRKKEIILSSTPREEETSTLVVDSEEEDEEEACLEVEVRSFVITTPSQVTWQGTVRTLAPLAVIATHLNMS